MLYPKTGGVSGCGPLQIDMGSFEELLTRLIEHEVELVLVGGFAAAAYGSTLFTQDVDVCMRFSPDNLMRPQLDFCHF